MGKIWRRSPYLTALTTAMVLYSLALTWWAWKLGIAVGTGTAPFPLGQNETEIAVPGYFQKLNWLLYPVFWPVMAAFIFFTWKWYVEAWQSLPPNLVLYRNSSAVSHAGLLEPFLSRLIVYRCYLVAFGVAIGLLLTVVDAKCLLHEYDVLPHKICGAPDFTVAFRLPRNFPNFSTDHTNELFGFVVAQYAMQIVLIAMAFIVLFQLLLHSVAFLAFERFNIPKQLQLSIRLNAQDQFGEFGLMEVNEAINLTYVFIAVAMTIPVLSVLNKPPGGDIGKSLMAILLPLLLFAPAVIPVFDRIGRRRNAAEMVRTANNPELTKSFREQRLWPFEQTGLSYVGKICLIAAVASWVYVLTGEMKNLLKVVGG